jgi:hypothetical protein
MSLGMSLVFSYYMSLACTQHPTTDEAVDAQQPRAVPGESFGDFSVLQSRYLNS